MHNKLDFTCTITREIFEEKCGPIFNECLNTVKKVIAEAKLKPSDFKNNGEIVLVGGSSRIPRIQDMLSELCDGKKLNFRVNPDEVVAYGATVLAASEKGLLP